MRSFEPFPDSITIGAKYGPAMEITDPAEAGAYFQACVEHTIRARRMDRDPLTREEAEAIERKNLGYYSGYYNTTTQAQVERVFQCVHPFFGSVAAENPPTVEQVFQMGFKLGEDLRLKAERGDNRE